MNEIVIVSAQDLVAYDVLKARSLALMDRVERDGIQLPSDAQRVYEKFSSYVTLFVNGYPKVKWGDFLTFNTKVSRMLERLEGLVGVKNE